MGFLGTSPKNKGLLYIHQGKLYDAEYGDLQEYEAACRLIAMDNVSFKIKALPKLEIRRRIKSELMSIIMDAMKMKDEVKPGETLELPPQSDQSDDGKKRRSEAFEADWRQSVRNNDEKENAEEDIIDVPFIESGTEPLIENTTKKRESDLSTMEAVFDIGHIPHVENAVLDDPMATQQLLNPRRRERRKALATGNPESGRDRLPFGLAKEAPVAPDLTHPLHGGPVKVCLKIGAQFASRDDPP